MSSPLVERAVIDALDNNNALLKFISPIVLKSKAFVKRVWA